MFVIKVSRRTHCLLCGRNMETHRLKPEKRGEKVPKPFDVFKAFLPTFVDTLLNASTANLKIVASGIRPECTPTEK